MGSERAIGRRCMDTILSRRSVRELSDRPVPEEAVKAILEAGAAAPSPHNTHPWKFVLLGEGARRRVADLLRELYVRKFGRGGDAVRRADRIRDRISGAQLPILLCVDRGAVRRVGDAEQARREAFMAAQSLAAAAENMWLAAVSMGLAGYWDAAPLATGEHLRAALGLEDELEPQMFLLIGYPAAQPRPKDGVKPDELTLRVN